LLLINNVLEDILEIAFGVVDLDYTKDVKINPALFRLFKVETLQGDYINI